MSISKVNVVQWMLDTHPLWLVTAAATPKEKMLEFKTVALRALSLLPVEEQQVVLRYYHVQDAKMSLASSLLKRLAITKFCRVPWSEAVSSRGTNGKPCYTRRTPGSESIEFNVSHQAGIVILIACICAPGEVQLGIDVVCVNERDDYARVEREGFFSWVDMHSDVFAPSETQALKMDTSQLVLPLPEGLKLAGYARDAIARCQYGGTQSSSTLIPLESKEDTHFIPANVVIETKLRRFYALWCLREAYVKMTGEALLAEWLQELEFRRFKTPSAFKQESLANTRGMELGEVVTEFEIYFKGKRVDDVTMELKAFGKDFMIASAARMNKTELSRVDFSGFAELELVRDIYTMAEAG